MLLDSSVVVVNVQFSSVHCLYSICCDVFAFIKLYSISFFVELEIVRKFVSKYQNRK